MRTLLFNKYGIYLKFAISDDNKLYIHGISDKDNITEFEKHKFFTPVELHTTGSNPDDHHGAKHTGGDILYYEGHTESEDQICFMLKNDKLFVKVIYDFFADTKTICAHSEIKNISDESIGIEYLSSFCVYGLKPEKIYIPHNAWSCELNWKVCTPDQLGYTKIQDITTKRILVSNTGSWSSKEYLPMGMIEEKGKILFWQIEHNGSWSWEISDAEGGLMYLKLSGPSEQENVWWKELKPGEEFVSVNTAISVVTGDFTDAVCEMTKYRRKIAYRNPADLSLPVIFNDYMCCLEGDPTTEKSFPVIDAAAKAGAEIYCMDCGWYDDGEWWDNVGEWQPCERRFPNGMNEVFDYVRSKGMIPGIWIEPESIGINCKLAHQFDDDYFFMRHGKRVIDHGRYHFDFRNQKVRDYLDSVVDRLVADYGIGYFKFDYNIEGGFGTEVDSDSYGDGLMQHNAAYLAWVDGVYKRHPNLIIENCSSGGMRMDYKTLTHFTLQSVTDANSYTSIAQISAMSPTAVVPEQAAIWSVPEAEGTLGEIAANMVNSMFKRIHLSGKTPWLNEEQFGVVKEGVDFYKSIRNMIPQMTAFFPFGVSDYNTECFVYGFSKEAEKYLCVVNLKGEKIINVPIGCEITEAEKVYPKCVMADVSVKGDEITVAIPEKSAVIIKCK